MDGVQLYIELVDEDFNSPHELIDTFLVNVSGGLTTSQTYSGVYNLAEITLTTRLVCLPGFPGEFCENFIETFFEDTATAITNIAPSTDTDTTDMDITPSTDMDVTSLTGTSDLVKITVSVVMVVFFVALTLLIILMALLGLLYSRKKKKSVKTLESVTYSINHAETESELGPAPNEEGFAIVGSVSLLYN